MATSDDRATTIAVDPSGSWVFVTGASTGKAGAAERSGLDDAMVQALKTNQAEQEFPRGDGRRRRGQAART